MHAPENYMSLERRKIKIFGLEIDSVDYNSLLGIVIMAINSRKKISITGVNVSTLNLIYNNEENFKVFSSFNVLHPDGIGIYFASKSIGDGGFSERITGSDFYPLLIERILEKKWKVFFLGDEDSTLEKIKIKHPNLNIVGFQNGFDFSTVELKTKINSSKPDILVVGMGAPKQEKWIYNNIADLDVSVVISVGEGIRVFAGNKVRGIKIIQKLGFEWFIRLINNPMMYWRRYIFGIPQFIYRFIKFEVIKNTDR